VKAVNEPLTASEDKALYRHAQANRAKNCMACGECQAACPDCVDVPAILRAKDYYHDQCGDMEMACQTYASLERTGSATCGQCDICERACPNGIPIRQRLQDARQLLAV
jgi:predicted aldo/keto reductase-like oxidoreductase